MSNAAKLLDGVLSGLRRSAGYPGGFDRWVDARRDQLVRSLDVLARRLRSQRREGRHADVGVVIPGARKHTWTPGDRITTADLVNVEQTDQPHRVVIKSNVLPGLDIEAERSRGVTPGAAWLKKKILDAVAAGPGLDQPKHRRLYVEGAEWLVQQLKPLKTPEEVTDFVDAWNEATRGRYLLPDVYSGADLKRMFPSGAHVGAGSDLVYNYSPEQLSELETLKVQRKAAHAAGNKERLAELRDRQWKISDAARVEIQHGALKHAGFAPMVKHRRDGTYQLYRQVPAEENTVGLQTLALAGVDGPSQDKVKRARLVSLITNRPKLYGTPAAFWKEDVPFAIDLDKKGDWSKLGPKQKAEESERSSGRWTRAATNQRRSGPPVKLPANLSGEDLLEAFGFRGIQYGNWVEDGSRDKYLPLAYEAFSDLADLLQQPRSFISHDGTLALAFGARGSGRASAHFEPSLQVVNLTHTRGTVHSRTSGPTSSITSSCRIPRRRSFCLVGAL
ncbi:hypothetical protein [Nannocystis pusilla]|uniref:hypothetical protein n=1 Tax=Nannocystis pusilla TaxID=889268 RepID=UPI003B78E386